MNCSKCHFDNPADTRFCGNCGTRIKPSEKTSDSFTATAQTPIREFTRGSTLVKRYEIIEKLGRGGMGQVFRVVDKTINEEMALKLINPAIASNEKTVERFKNELKFARKITHKNVCRMFDINESEETLYITMEYVPGEDLKSMIKMMGQLSVGRAISVAKQVCEGLAEAHKLGVVHRDLKPQNIMIDKEGNTRIMDFGVARSLEAEGITGAGMMVGTPEYMSPEQVKGEETDQRSDIYALGVILFEMLSGRLPFEGDTSLSIALKHKTDPTPNPREFNAQIPENLSQLILKCLEKEKEIRYQTAEEVFSELARIEQGIPVPERVVLKRKPLTSKEVSVSFSLRKLSIPIFVFFVIIIAGLIIWHPWSQKEAVQVPTDKPSLAIMYFQNNTGEEGLNHWRLALCLCLITDLSQSKYIYVLSQDKLFGILKKLRLLEAKSYTPEDLKKVAVEGGVNHILHGALSKAGDTFRIDYSLLAADTLKSIGLDQVKGEGEGSFFEMVDELTKRIKADFKLSVEEIETDIDREVGKITTSSPKARDFYVEGIRYYNEKKFEKSIEQLMKAVKIDPEFAMAYKQLALSYGYWGYRKEAKKYHGKALELLDRVSERERYLIKGSYYNSVEQAYIKAIKTYLELLNVYPDDEEAKLVLGAIYINLEEWVLALDWYNKVLQTNSRSYKAYNNIAYIYMAEGRYDQARKIIQDNKEIFPSQIYFYRNMAHAYLYQGKYKFALHEVDEALSLDPGDFTTIALKGNIHHVEGDLISARKYYMKLLEGDDPKSQVEGRLWMAHLHLLQGQYDKCMDEIIEGIKHSKKYDLKYHESTFMLFLAYLNFRLNRLTEALETTKQAMKIALEANEANDQKWVLHLQGLVYLKMKKMDEAKEAAVQLEQLIEETENKKHNSLLIMTCSTRA